MSAKLPTSISDAKSSGRTSEKVSDIFPVAVDKRIEYKKAVRVQDRE